MQSESVDSTGMYFEKHIGKHLVQIDYLKRSKGQCLG